MNQREDLATQDTKPGLKSLMGAPAARNANAKRFSLKLNLTQLAARGDVKQIAALLQDGVDDVDERSPNGSTPLMIAAKYGKLAVVELLLDYGATSAREALEAAQESGQEVIVERLNSALKKQ